MGMGILGIAVTGLNAAQAGIRTTEHNISNVNTPGYRRQEAVYVTETASYNGAGWFGNGVAIETVRNEYSQFLDNEVLRDQTQLSRHEIYAAQAGQVDGLLGDSNSGMSTSLTAFFASVNEVANDPTSSAARQVMLASGRNLAGRMNNLYENLQQKAADSNSAIASLSTQINTYASQVATLNQSISRIEALNGQPANDLRDQRAQAIADLNKLVDVTTVQQGGGELNVFIGNGQVLVANATANQFTVPAVDSNDAYNLSPASRLPQLNVSGANLTLDSRQITGGEMGGWLAVRDEVLKPALADLNRIAVAVGHALNQSQNAGLYHDTATGTMRSGNDLFSNMLTQTGGATSTLDFQITSSTQPALPSLPNETYRVTALGGGNYSLTNLSGGPNPAAPVAAGAEVLDAAGNKLGFKLSEGVPAPVGGETWELDFRDYARVMAVQLSNIEQIATAQPANTVVAAAAANTGSASIGSVQATGSAILPLPPGAVSLTYDSGTGAFAVTGATPAVANLAYTAPGPQDVTFNGVTLSITGTPAHGDVFTVTGPGPGDNGNALAMADLQTTGLLDDGATTASSAYTQVVSQGAALASAADVDSQAYATLTKLATDAQQSVSGVNLDEEAVNLIRYQQAYQAAAKAIAVANTLFDEILAIGR